MADISTELQAIREAVYGEQVRGAIVDALEAMNENAEAAEAWATGGSGGTAGATNNAKYYAEQAEAAQEAAEEAAQSFVLDDTLSETGKAADAAAVGNKISQVFKENATDMIVNFSDYMNGKISEIPFMIAGSGSVNNTTGGINSSGTYSYTDYIDVEAFRHIQYLRVSSAASSINFGIALYDSEKNFLYGKAARSATLGYSSDEIPIPDNAKYLRCTVISDTETYGEFSVSGNAKTEIQNAGNIWPYGDVIINNSSGVVSYPVSIPAGRYIVRLRATGKYRSAGGRLWFQNSKRIGTVESAARIGVCNFAYNEVTETSINLESDAYSLAFLAGVEVSASAGGLVYITDIEIVPEDKATTYNPETTFVDAFARNAAEKDAVVDYSSDFIVGKYIATNSTIANINTFVTSERYRVCVVACRPNEKYRIIAFGQETPRTWAIIKSDGTVIAVSNGESGQENNRHLVPIDVVIPPDGAYLIVNHYTAPDSGYLPKVYKLSGSADVNAIAEAKHEIPKVVPEWKRHIVAAYKYFLVKNISGKISRSADAGKTWSEELDISSVGLVKSYHLYANGCLGFFTHQKAYYTEDFQTFSEAVCYEQDGTTAYDPAEYENFYTIFDVNERKVINGQDMYVFGNYVVNGSPATRRLIWYSIDNGHTYKIAYEFNLENTLKIRHVHEILYYADQDVFICATGDSNATECWVIKMEYDATNDSWTLTPFNESSARAYKWAMLAVWGDELYFTFDNTPGEVRKCRYSEIADTSKHVSVLNGGKTADVVGLAIGKRGDMIVTLSHSRSAGGATINYALAAGQDCRTIFYSSDREHFHKIFADPTIADSYSGFSGFLPVTSDGHFICGTHGGGGTSSWDKTPSIYLDECVRLAGFNDAFKPF